MVRTEDACEIIKYALQNEIKVYNSKDKPCPNCNTPLHKIFVKGRGTTYCPKCQKNPALAKFIAITGPIAAGKSSVLNIFNKLGYKIISSDDLVNSLYNDPKFLKLIWSRFKLDKMDSKSTKLAISKLISNNPKEKEKLEKIIHPIIINMIIDIHFSSKKDDKIIFEIPVLMKSGLINFVDKLIYVDAKEDVRSSYVLEQCATEFDIQGLELDYSVVAWDADYRFVNGEWAYNNFVGNRWNAVSSEERKLYLKNAYRVLLTRARQGMAIFVPRGSEEDATRPSEFYDGIYNYLKNIGIEEI